MIIEDKHSISMRLGDRTVWKFNHDPEEGKPYFHPLATTAGKVLTDLRPDDHPWHRGLWFSWKYINSINYWEEDRNTGKSEGQTLLTSVNRETSADQEVTIEMRLAYAPRPDDDPVLTETRVVKVSPPDDQGCYTIDWSSRFEATNRDVVLDRTPLEHEPGGKSWGGYAGYSLRMGSAARGGVFSNSDGQTGSDTHRQRAAWMSYHIPGSGGLLFMDHPKNLRHPAPWYVSEGMPFMSPALLNDGQHTLASGESLSLRYRLVVFPDNFSDDECARIWDNWRNAE